MIRADNLQMGCVHEERGNNSSKKHMFSMRLSGWFPKETRQGLFVCLSNALTIFFQSGTSIKLSKMLVSYRLVAIGDSVRMTGTYCCPRWVRNCSVNQIIR